MFSRVRTSYKQPHQLVTHGVLKTYNLSDKTQNRIENSKHNRKSTAYLYLNKLCVWKFSRFPFPSLCFPVQISMNVPICSRLFYKNYYCFRVFHWFLQNTKFISSNSFDKFLVCFLRLLLGELVIGGVAYIEKEKKSMSYTLIVWPYTSTV